MSQSRQEKRRLNKKKMQPKTPEPSKNMVKLPLCYPNDCNIECNYKTWGENAIHEYDEVLKKYLLLSHVEKTEYPDENFSSIEVFSKVFCPPDTMFDYEDDVQEQINSFFEEIDIEYDEFGGGTGFFSASANISDEEKIDVI